MEEQEPTELARTATSDTELAFAWSEGEPAEIVDYRRQKRITAAAVGAALVLIAGAGAVAALTLRDTEPPPVGASPSVTTTVTAEPAAESTTMKPRPTPPPTDVETAALRKLPPPAPDPPQIPMDVVAAYDRQFIAVMAAKGWVITDPSTMTFRAHQVCAMLQQGMSRETVSDEMSREFGITLVGARQFTSVASATYPDCP